jgi:hypothetical protein
VQIFEWDRHGVFSKPFAATGKRHEQDGRALPASAAEPAAGGINSGGSRRKKGGTAPMQSRRRSACDFARLLVQGFAGR